MSLLKIDIRLYSHELDQMIINYCSFLKANVLSNIWGKNSILRGPTTNNVKDNGI